MKVQAVQHFIDKLSLINNKKLLHELEGIIERVESSQDMSTFLSQCQKNQNVYSFKIQQYTLYFSIIGDEMYFIDIIEPVTVFHGPSSRNPRINSSINPRFNSSINPRINSSINPRINSRINPRINSSINPRINSSINPRINQSINGLYVYDVEKLTCVYYCVSVPNNDNVLIVYDYHQLDAVFLGVKRASGYCIFNVNSLDYVGFLESNGKDDGYNWFDTELNWMYFVV